MQSSCRMPCLSNSHRVTLLLIFGIITLAVVYSASVFDLFHYQYFNVDKAAPTRPEDATLGCRQLNGAEHVLVVMKTGATELEAKLPIHLRTTMQCYADSVIFSDLEEDFDGHHIYNALEQVSEQIRSTHDDFDLYRRLQSHGRQALETSELSSSLGTDGGKLGKPDNAGWRLDKWKFLPMMNSTLTMYPDKKWYVFVETDTYLVWSNLLQWIAVLDSERPIYAGLQMQIADQIFAHGGSGFVVSNYAMRLVTDLFARNTTWWEDFTDGHWAGDCVLGKAFEQAGSPLLWSWPLIQGDKPEILDFWKQKGDIQGWCYPAVTYHHLSADEVENIWRFEQEWIHEQRPTLRQSDVFKMLVMPHLVPERDDWDNLSDNGEGDGPATPSQCHDICEVKSECMQYRVADGKCTTSEKIKLGQPASDDTNLQSGFMMDRINEAVRGKWPCWGEEWIT